MSRPTIHNTLEKYRRRMRFSQRQVASLLGYRDSTPLSSYEHGRRMPPLLTALRLGIVLRVPVEFLYPALYEQLRTDIRGREEQRDRQQGGRAP